MIPNLLQLKFDATSMAERIKFLEAHNRCYPLARLYFPQIKNSFGECKKYKQLTNRMKYKSKAMPKLSAIQEADLEDDHASQGKNMEVDTELMIGMPGSG
ncbi:hypothetical protein BHM03_00033623 [Ensete ventricosum]|nr:hypothetical protein BHM03_00033623 [Ensete ventricosum]